MKKPLLRRTSSLVSIILFFLKLNAQNDTIAIAENLVTDGISPLPSAIIEDAGRYANARAAFISDWHPLKKEMLIATRFANTFQVHSVKMPGGERKQITFFNEPIDDAIFNPATGDYFLYTRDAGGNEFSQMYRYDLAGGKSFLLTDGKRSQNGNILWNDKGDKIVYTSTHRNGADRDIYTMNPMDSSTNKLIVEVSGGGWGVSDWSKDEKKLLLQKGISVNEVQLWMYDFDTNTKTKLLPKDSERVVYTNAFFSKDGKGIYLITDKDNEFARLAWYDIASGNISILTPDIHWSIDNATITKDGKQIAFTANEAGESKLYIMNTATKKYVPVTAIPTGIIGGLLWHADGKSLGITYNSSNTSSDVYEWNTETNKLIRWTESELGGIDVSGITPPQLVKWKSFDGKEISGFLYKANKKFTGKRPVIINIHGGPEGQSRPTFIGRSNYYINELGVSVIFPNVRGSTGYGKTFADLDNSMKREDAVNDIGALIDWIATQPDLDASRIMITGGSYGGYMTLACATHFNDKIKCALDVVGPSNFNTFLKNTESYRRDLRRVEYGDERDTAMAAFFERTAPLNNAGNITKPMFIVQGKNDPRVPYTESQQMQQKIKANGTTVWYLMANDEGHGFQKKANQDFLFYATVEFIKKYLL